MKTLQRFKPIVFVEFQPDYGRALLDFFHQQDYLPYWFASKRYQANNFFRHADIGLGLDVNFIAIPHTLYNQLPQLPVLNALWQLLQPVQNIDELFENSVKLLELTN